MTHKPVDKSQKKAAAGAERPIMGKLGTKASIAESRFQFFDVNIDCVRSRIISPIIQSAETQKMTQKQFERLVDEKVRDGVINLDEARFALSFYGPYRASFRPEDRETPQDLIQYLKREQMTQGVLQEMGYASFYQHAFERGGRGRALAVLSGALITGESGSENILFCGFLGAVLGHRDPALYNEMIRNVGEHVRAKTGNETRVVVGEVDRFEDFTQGCRREITETAVLEAYMADGGYAVKGLRWLQVLPEEGHYQARSLPEPESGRWQELTLILRTSDGHRVTRDELKAIVRELYIYYDVGGRKIAGTERDALGAYVNYTMRHVPENPKFITDRDELIKVPRKGESPHSVTGSS